MFGTKVLEERESKYNGHLRVLSTWGMGTYIQSNGLTQSGGIVEQIWKQTLKKLNAKSILILGLGGGTVARLLRKKYPNSEILGIEIDPIIIELGKKYLDLDKAKVNIKIKDAKDLPTKIFDLVIVDLYNGDEYPKNFESEKFLKKISKNKLIIFNRLYYKEKKQEALEFDRKLRKYFKNVNSFFPVANIMFVCSN